MELLKKSRTLRLLCYATLISSLGDSLYSLAITLTVYGLSGSIMGVAGMWMIRALIRIPCQFFSGIIVDRYNRKKISIGIYLISAVFVFVFTLVNNVNIVWAYVLIFILQGTSDVDNMAQNAMLPELVNKEELAIANTIFHYIGIVVSLIGPGLGGIMYTQFGGTLLYVVDAISFVVAAIIMIFVPYQYKQKKREQVKFTLFKFAKEGIVEIKKHRFIQSLMAIGVFFGILGRIYEIDKVYLADTILNIGADGIIYFSYAMSIGTILAPLVLKIFKNKENTSVKEFIILSVLTVVAFIIWGNAKNLGICLFGSVLIGLFSSGRGLYTNVVLQKSINRDCMGRVMALNKICIVGSAIIGVALAPVLLEVIGVGGSINIIGIITIICMFFVVYFERKTYKKLVKEIN